MKDADALTWTDFHRFLAPAGRGEAWRRNFYFRWLEFPEVVRALAPRPGERLLEVGSAWISTTPLLLVRRFGCRVTCVDVQPLGGPERARVDRLLDRLRFTDQERSRLTLVSRDAAALDLDLPPLDGAYAISTLEHLPGDGDAAAIRHMARRVRPGGRVVISVPFTFGEPIEGDVSEGEEHRQRWYDPGTIFARLIEPSGLALEEARFLVETRPRVGETFRRLGPRGRVLFAAALRPLHRRLWRVAFVARGNALAALAPGEVPFGIRVDRGALVLRLRKPPDGSAPRADRPRASVVRRRYLLDELELAMPRLEPEGDAVRSGDQPVTTWNDVLRFTRRGAIRREVNLYGRWGFVPALIDATDARPGDRVLAWLPEWADVVPAYLAQRRAAAVDVLAPRPLTHDERVAIDDLIAGLRLTRAGISRVSFADDGAALLAETAGTYDRAVSAFFADSLPPEAERGFAEGLGRFLRPGGRAALAVQFRWGAHRELPEPEGVIRRLYNRDSVGARIVAPSGLRVARALVVGERFPGLGQRVRRLAGDLGVGLFAALARPLAGWLWKTYADLDGDGFAAMDPARPPGGLASDRAILVLVLEKPA